MDLQLQMPAGCGDGMPARVSSRIQRFQEKKFLQGCWETDGNGTIEIWAGNEKLGAVSVAFTDNERKCFSGALKPVSGVHPLCLEWRMELGCEAVLQEIKFI